MPACPLGLLAGPEGDREARTPGSLPSGCGVTVSPVPRASCPLQKLVNENMDTLVQLRSSSCKPEQMAALLPRLTCEFGGESRTWRGSVGLAHAGVHTHTHTRVLTHTHTCPH